MYLLQVDDSIDTVHTSRPGGAHTRELAKQALSCEKWGPLCIAVTWAQTANTHRGVCACCTATACVTSREGPSLVHVARGVASIDSATVPKVCKQNEDGGTTDAHRHVGD